MFDKSFILANRFKSNTLCSAATECSWHLDDVDTIKFWRALNPFCFRDSWFRGGSSTPIFGSLCKSGSSTALKCHNHKFSELSPNPSWIFIFSRIPLQHLCNIVENICIQYFDIIFYSRFLEYTHHTSPFRRHITPRIPISIRVPRCERGLSRIVWRQSDSLLAAAMVKLFYGRP